MEVYINLDPLKDVPREIERIALSIKDNVMALKTKIPYEANEFRDFVERVTDTLKR